MKLSLTRVNLQETVLCTAAKPSISLRSSERINRKPTRWAALGVAFGLAVTPAALYSQSAAATPPAPSVPGSADVQKVIQQYILDHPEVVLESVRRYSERQKAAEQAHKQASVTQHQNELYRDAASPVTAGAEPGTDTATVVEFFDYRCGYCRKVEDSVSRFAGKSGVRIVYKELPILGPDSMLAAQAALAAEKQGAYQKFHHALLTSPIPLTAESIDSIAAASGLDVAKLKRDMAAPEIKAEIARNNELATSLGIQATPTFVVGQKIVSGAMSPDEFQELINSERMNAATPAGPAGGGQ